MLPSRIDIESEFHQVVRDYGGVVIEDLLGSSPSFKNADYVFHFEKVVAELKCITANNALRDDNLVKAQQVITAWHVSGKYASPILDLKDWATMPTGLQTELYRIFTRSIKKRVAKANRQIRETKSELKLHDYKGLLFIVNDGLLSLPPAAFIHAVQLVLQRDFSEIRHFVFLTVNIFTQTREVPLPSLFWISFDMEDGARVDPQFLDRLGRDWRRHCANKMGAGFFESEMHDIEGFWNAQNIGML